MQIKNTEIPGLIIVELDIFPDERGSFKESWQNAKLIELGGPELNPVQQNISINKKGVTRGIHAEPWDKYVHVAHGRVYGAYLDLRKDSGAYGKLVTLELDQTCAVIVPKGVGNAFQALEEDTVYTYLVNDHWRPGIVYPAVAFDDPELNIAWPIKEGMIVSEKDMHNPKFSEL